LLGDPGYHQNYEVLHLAPPPIGRGHGASIEGLVAGCHQVQEAIEGLAAPVQSFMSAIGGIGEAVIAAFAAT
jgi:hypothetical protein